ncbi:hypothetical protein SARC_07144 [Sphaeroforma arctica JP610]|uniref:Small ribosomal subunit protein uS2 n=1 Tax=Sphaeroforma arctica JP610 TaxID=667725 RepID=A0A0L0FUJ3_9EUKA|nr:hypothetical protein SARC_07144 [Sphaeroforma arctica JP610]KNC80502.1 hypothetical protein SARC_07144 [Sphaeroforma arctica JP610]|eukprot:XP_014154404.1 hypothetical protein SARC_07144 [Sphaeroforma arctica JP610]
MSGNSDILAPTEDDISKMLMAKVHIGTKNVDHQMQQYVYKRRSDGIFIFNLHKVWEKLMLAARVLVTIENPADVCVISGREFGQRAILKYAAHTGATPVAGRWTPGTFTNQITRAFKEPRILVVTDPRTDFQAIIESSYVNLPVIAFCDSDSPLRHVDIAIPCNNKSVNSIGLMWWFLAREVLRLRGTVSRQQPWEIMPDLYFYRSQEDQEKEDEEAVEAQLKANAFDSQPAFENQPPAEEIADDNADWASMSNAAAGQDWSASVPSATADPAAEWGAADAAPAAGEGWGAAQ